MAPKVELPLRIVLVRPPAGVTFCLQRGKDERVEITRSTGEVLAFVLSVQCVHSPDGPDFRGPFVQGPKGGRFIYVNSGKRAGDSNTCIDRRAKVHLSGITRAMIDELQTTPGAVLLARFQGTGKDGGPSCATVPLLDGGWQVVAR